MSDPAAPSLEDITAATNSSNLNAFILEAFLCGIHCVVFAHAAWRLFRLRNWILMTFLTIQWIISIIVLSMDWFITNLAFLRNGDTSYDTMETLAYKQIFAGKTYVADFTFTIMSILLCNGFLIFRCRVHSGKNVVLTIILSMVFVASIVLGFIFVFPTQKMMDDTYGTLPASISVAFFASSAAIALVVSSFIVRSTARGKRLTFKNVLAAIVDGAVPFSQVMTTLAFVAVVSLPSIYESGHIKQLLVNELNTYLQFPLPPLAGLTTALIALRMVNEAKKTPSAQEFSDSSYSRMTFTRTILVPKGEE